MKKLVCFRYILPAILVLLTLAATLIPCVSFTVKGEVREARSVAALAVDAFGECRDYVASTVNDGKDNVYTFSVLVLGGVILGAAVGAAAAAVSCWSSAMALLAIYHPDREKTERARTSLRRIMPSGGWMLAVNAAALVPVAFPHYLALLYTNVLHINTGVSSGLTVSTLLLWALCVALAAVARSAERELGICPFN